MARRTPSPVRGELAHVGLEFAIGRLDRVEIGGILRQVAQRCAGYRTSVRDQRGMNKVAICMLASGG